MSQNSFIGLDSLSRFREPCPFYVAWLFIIQCSGLWLRLGIQDSGLGFGVQGLGFRKVTDVLAVAQKDLGQFSLGFKAFQFEDLTMKSKSPKPKKFPECERRNPRMPAMNMNTRRPWTP